MKKISIIGTVGLPAKYGGFETLTEYLTKYLNKDYDITVYCSGKSYSEKQTSYNNCQLKYINLRANGAQSIPYDIISILSSLKNADTLLILGVSGCIILPFVRLFSKKNIVVNIDGLEWKRDKWNKYVKWFLKFSEKIAVRFADVVVADNKVIQDYVSDEYSVESQLIAYGADHVNKENTDQSLLNQYPFLGKKYAFKVCRIEPENNIHIILKAFGDYKKLNLVIIGNWENSDYGKQIKTKYADCENIYLLDPIYEQSKLNKIRSNCYLYVHGHSAGGTNPSLVEAMYLGLPIVAFDVAYNRATTNNQANYFSNHLTLIELISNMGDMQLSDNAKKMKGYANISYTWKSIAQQYSDLF